MFCCGVHLAYSDSGVVADFKSVQTDSVIKIVDIVCKECALFNVKVMPASFRKLRTGPV